MAKSVTQYDLLISCPGEIKEEIECIKSAVEQFNSSFSDALGISIQVKHWSKNSYPQSGGKPQALLNEQFVNDCDAAVAIMWTKFGTPTDEYGSGTEEEIEIMLKDGKQVFMYFCDKPISPSEMNSDEYKRVKAFRDKYKDRGIYSTYTTIEDFQRNFYAHLSQYFLSLKKVESLKNEKHSNLLIKGIDPQNHISDNVVIENNILINAADMNKYSAKIMDYYSKIDAIKTAKRIRNPLLSNTFDFLEATEIGQCIKINITEFANALKINLSDNFFDLGDLRGPFGNIQSYSDMNGTEEEKRKYQLILALNEILENWLHWDSVKDKLSVLKYVRLVLTNNGTDYDEDIDISLYFPEASLVTIDSFPKLSDEDKKYLMLEKNMDAILHIYASAEYLDYSESITIQNPLSSSVKAFSGTYGSTYDDSDRFDECLSDTLGFNVYPAGDKYVVKIHFDYIKHNTSVAFPSLILLFDDISEIPYTITSKYCSEKVQGTILVTNSETDAL